MTEQPGPWRPAPPKASSALDTRNAPRTASAGPHTTRPSAAIRGAAQAFLSRPAPVVVKTNTGGANGARAAAAGAKNIVRPATAPRHENGNQKDTILVRGRQLGPNPVRSPPMNDSSASLLSGKGPPPPPPARSASKIAAQMASASSSPVRSSSSSPRRGGSPRRNYTSRSPGRNIAVSPLADLSEPVPALPDSSMISAPRPIRPMPLTSNSRPILDLDRVPALPRNLSTSSSQTSPPKGSPNNLAQAAARYATPGASPFELDERTSYLNHAISTKVWASPSNPDSDLGSPLGLTETRSTLGTDSSKSAQSPQHTTIAGPVVPKTAAIPIRGRGAQKATTKPSPGSGQLKDFRTGMTQTTLADAIVASSVASSRASSPSKRDRPPVPPGRSRSHSLLHHKKHHDPISETGFPPTPIRSMKHTLRKQSKQDDDVEETGIMKRGRRHFVRKHPNKHHEGDRKRWRDKVTERERKRYEGVWAANRGLYVFWDSAGPTFGQTAKPAGNDDLVVNVVVREIWERSRLPKDNLEEIWDLVAQPDAKALGRWEFIVGLWLIDQRLKGRKLPTRVSQSVWASVRNNIGLKVSSKPIK